MEERWAGGGGVRSGLGAVFVLVEESHAGKAWGGVEGSGAKKALLEHRHSVVYRESAFSIHDGFNVSHIDACGSGRA